MRDGSDAFAYGTSDMTMAHMHSCYELLMILDDIPYSTVIDGKMLHGRGSMVIMVDPYCMHFTRNTCGKRSLSRIG